MSSQNFEPLGMVVCPQPWGWEHLTQQGVKFCQNNCHLLFLSDHCLFTYEPTKLRHRFRKHDVSKLEVI